jgi:hypothetical protein
MAFKDMTSHCEALTIGKQQKMSAFMSFQQSVVQGTGLPSSQQPNEMELALFQQDPQLPQVECSKHLPFSQDHPS